MRNIAKQIEQRPHYYNGQLLREDDFLREQNFHLNARRRHNLNLHGSGVVSGLRLKRNGDGKVILEQGCAIDSTGREIVITDPETIDLDPRYTATSLRISLQYTESESAPNQKAVTCSSIITVSKAADDHEGVTLALIHVDANGNFGDADIYYGETNYIRTVQPGSVRDAALAQNLKRGWLRMPFRPTPLVNVPPGETEIPPHFRIGATEAVTRDPREAGKNDSGAAGTMAIALPPNATRVRQLRIAGPENKGDIQVAFYIGGWDAKKKESVRDEILKTTITTKGAFEQTLALPDKRIDPEFNTASLWLRATRRCRISLIAVEVVYFDR